MRASAIWQRMRRELERTHTAERSAGLPGQMHKVLGGVGFDIKPRLYEPPHNLSLWRMPFCDRRLSAPGPVGAGLQGATHDVSDENRPGSRTGRHAYAGRGSLSCTESDGSAFRERIRRGLLRPSEHRNRRGAAGLLRGLARCAQELVTTGISTQNTPAATRGRGVCGHAP
jgi:hypothetical protein